jgi:hypothetical protein
LSKLVKMNTVFTSLGAAHMSNRPILRMMVNMLGSCTMPHAWLLKLAARKRASLQTEVQSVVPVISAMCYCHVPKQWRSENTIVRRASEHVLTEVAAENNRSISPMSRGPESRQKELYLASPKAEGAGRKQ